MHNHFRISPRILPLALSLLSLQSPLVRGEDEPETAWNQTLKAQFFGDRPIAEDQETLEIVAPYRAEDPALVPIQIKSKFPQTPSRFIRKITLLIDNNPVPFAAAFEFTPLSGQADLATRLRFNAYTYIRAIAETNDGSLHMSKAFVKASGGCSAPLGTDSDAAMARLGRMKFKLDPEKPTLGQSTAVQLLISHPNITGMQMNQISRLVQPAHYVTDVQISFDGQPVLNIKGDIAVSSDPNFRFYLKPERAGELKATIKDNLGGQFAASETLTP